MYNVATGNFLVLLYTIVINLHLLKQNKDTPTNKLEDFSNKLISKSMQAVNDVNTMDKSPIIMWIRYQENNKRYFDFWLSVI